MPSSVWLVQVIDTEFGTETSQTEEMRIGCIQPKKFSEELPIGTEVPFHVNVRSIDFHTCCANILHFLQKSLKAGLEISVIFIPLVHRQAVLLVNALVAYLLFLLHHRDNAHHRFLCLCRLSSVCHKQVA